MRDSARPVIVLTGGGTAGHVMPNLALLPYLQSDGFHPIYIGSKGIEKEIVESAGIEFHSIQSGKLRRYISIENFKDIFKVMLGVLQSFALLQRIKPVCVFSKGGFVAVPVAVAAWLRGIPVISHESDVSPGLANRIISRFAKMNLYAFPETGRYLSGHPNRLVGTPVRDAIYEGDRQRGLALCGWDSSDLPVVLFMGGSQGAQFINDLVQSSLQELLPVCRVVHLTGRGKQPAPELALQLASNYKSFEFLGQEMPDVLAAANLVVSRAGANSIFELRALQKPMLLIPLEKGSRGDQILNAESFRQNGWASVLREGDASPQSLVATVRQQLQAASLLETGPNAILAQGDGKASDRPGNLILAEIHSALRARR